jgi:hypothetical protein
MHNELKEYEEMSRDVEHEQHRCNHSYIQDVKKVVAIIVDDVKREYANGDIHVYNE